MTEWQAANDRDDRDRINRARQAAEDLFKRTQQNNGAPLPNSTPNAGSSPDQRPRRQPRIFAIPAQAPKGPEVETPVVPKPVQRKTVARRESNGVVLPSQEGRVRALTSYGMTPAQVAELYEVSVDKIEGIIRRPPRTQNSG